MRPGRVPGARKHPAGTGERDPAHGCAQDPGPDACQRGRRGTRRAVPWPAFRHRQPAGLPPHDHPVRAGTAGRGSRVPAVAAEVPGRPAVTDMDPVETHLARVLAAIRPVEPARLGLEAAEGTVLAADAGAVTPLPSFDNSSMDGYAVHAADIAVASAEAPVTLPVTDQIPAGDTRAVTVAPGTSV